VKLPTYSISGRPLLDLQPITPIPHWPLLSDPRDSGICFQCIGTHFGLDLGLPYTSSVSWGRGIPHVSVTHTPLAAVSIFNKSLNSKNFTPSLQGQGLPFSLS